MIDLPIPNTIVIENTVPTLGNHPLVEIIRTRASKASRTTVIIFLTPTLVKPAGDPLPDEGMLIAPRPFRPAIPG